MRAVSFFESLKIIGDHWTLRRRKTKAGSPSSLQWTLEPWWLQVWRIWIWWIFNRWGEHSWVKIMLYPLTIFRHIERQAFPGGRGTNGQMLSMFSVFALTTEQAITSINPSTSSLVFHSVTPVFHDNFVYRAETKPLRGNLRGNGGRNWWSVLDEVWMSKKDRAAMSCRTMVLCEVESFEVVLV